MKRNFGTLTLLIAVILMTAAIGCDRVTPPMVPTESGASEGMMPPMTASDEEASVRYGL